VADKAAVMAANAPEGDQVGTQTLPVTLPMMKNHLKRHADMALRHSWFHWHNRAKERDIREAGHGYLENSVLWCGGTVDRTLPKEIQHEMAEERNRWLRHPKEIAFAAESFQAAKAVVHLRLYISTSNTSEARRTGFVRGKKELPKCPWCRKEKDSPRHRFECETLEPARLQLAEALHDAAYSGSKADEDEVDDPRQWSQQRKQFSGRALFKWDLLIKGNYKEAPETERYTEPCEEARKEMAKVTHAFLAKTRFYRRVFAPQADMLLEVKAAARAKKRGAQKQQKLKREQEKKQQRAERAAPSEAENEAMARAAAGAAEGVKRLMREEQERRRERQKDPEGLGDENGGGSSRSFSSGSGSAHLDSEEECAEDCEQWGQWEQGLALVADDSKADADYAPPQPGLASQEEADADGESDEMSTEDYNSDPDEVDRERAGRVEGQTLPRLRSQARDFTPGRNSHSIRCGEPVGSRHQSWPGR
jgi:hypothetical protein